MSPCELQENKSSQTGVMGGYVTPIILPIYRNLGEGILWL